ncbi:MAG: methionine--tRNA ligase subunit beta [Planctomycetes bacterium]|nr:methionine--tRNA ligase subunit beta [Planctomycetota bacterium]
MSDHPESSSDAAGKSPTPAPEAPPETPRITIDQFAAVELRTGRVVAAEAHPDADRLLVMKVDTGDAEPRQIVAGIRSDWSPEDIVGKTLIICCNLKPAKLRGVVSQGMMLAVKGDERVWPLTLEGQAAPGTRVT